jgi:hypothetical protein
MYGRKLFIPTIMLTTGIMMDEMTEPSNPLLANIQIGNFTLKDWCNAWVFCLFLLRN